MNLGHGLAASICDPDWERAFRPATDGDYWARSMFFLTSVPHLSSGPIEITVDGQIVAPTAPDGSTAWFLDPVMNVIKFEPMHVPPPGSMIQITYFTGCYP